MKEIDIIKSLVGEMVTEDNLRFVDSYVHNKMGLFIPSVGACEYARKLDHTHPSYMLYYIFLRTLRRKNNKLNYRTIFIW